jgi:ABC-type transport system involved in multi-copper enzyme maturation permease subunit
MIPSIKSEFRKLLSIRSTYVIIGLAFILIMFLVSFFAQGYKLSPGELRDHGQLNVTVTAAGTVLGVFITLIAVLLATQEYRYNTIMYSLTAAKKRSYVLGGKIVAITIFSLAAAAIFAILAPLFAKLGVAVHGQHMVPQHLDIFSLAWRSLVAGWVAVMFGLIIGFLVRVQVGAVVLMLLMPTTLEPISQVILHARYVYMPFTSISAILQFNSVLSYAHAALVATGYAVGGMIVAWLLFLKRDAN